MPRKIPCQVDAHERKGGIVSDRRPPYGAQFHNFINDGNSHQGQNVRTRLEAIVYQGSSRLTAIDGCHSKAQIQLQLTVIQYSSNFDASLAFELG